MRHIFARNLAVLFILSCGAAFAGPGAEPAPPVKVEEIRKLEWGAFCAGRLMDRAPAPGTASGWIHVPKDDIAFHWPEQRVVPAVLGMGFGLKATGQRDWQTEVGEVRVWRPGAKQPESWASDISAHGPTLAFFRFDTPDELVTGTWIFEGVDRGRQLYRVEFEVVAPSALPGMAQSCGATS